MRRMTFGFGALALAVGLLAAAQAPASHAGGETVCRLKFNLKSWSAFYKSGKGEGTITCENGQSAAVKIRTQGGGITFGKSEIKTGHGTFSDVSSIDELFGTYAAAEAHAGAVKSSGAQALTKGEVSLAVSGTGEGVDVGFAFGSFKIERK